MTHRLHNVLLRGAFGAALGLALLGTVATRALGQESEAAYRCPIVLDHAETDTVDDRHRQSAPGRIARR